MRVRVSYNVVWSSVRRVWAREMMDPDSESHVVDVQ